jgi:hypothetical protein
MIPQQSLFDKGSVYLKRLKNSCFIVKLNATDKKIRTIAKNLV